MNFKKSVTANEATQAAVAKQILLPAVAALRKVTSQALGYNTADLELCIQTLLVLENHIDGANGVTEALAAHKDELGDLIGKVAMRSMSIASDVERHEVMVNTLIKNQEFQIDELKFKGFTSDQIEKISPFPQTEIDEHKAAIEALKAEKGKLERFIKSSPAFEIEHLLGTTFEKSAEIDERKFALAAESEA